MKAVCPKVCIDAVPLLVRSAGIKTYLHFWIDHLQQLGCGSIELFPYIQELGQLDHEGSASGRLSTLARLGLLYMLNLRENHFMDRLAPDLDVFHTCKLLHPPRRARLTATLHDVTCWLMPECHMPANVAAEKRFAERILKRADGLIAVSESTRNDAARVLGLAPERIEVIYHGIAEAYFQIAAADVARARRQYGLQRPYILFVGTLEPRKNVGLLLDAYESLSEGVREEFEMVIAGPAGWFVDSLLRRLERPEPRVRYLGYVPESALPGLFGGAAVFAYLSLYEGFGFPVAQALAAGVPVLTSAVSSLPEITGSAAELVDPRSPAEVRAGLCRLLTSPSRRLALAEAGRAAAQRFRWEYCARQSLEFFARVAGRC